MLKSIVGWMLATASLLLGILWFFGILTFVPPEPLMALVNGLGHGLGWVFGTALPGLGDIILDRLRHATTNAPVVAPPTTTIP